MRNNVTRVSCILQEFSNIYVVNNDNVAHWIERRPGVREVISLNVIGICPKLVLDYFTLIYRATNLPSLSFQN